MHRLEVALAALFVLAAVALLAANVISTILLANGIILAAAGLKGRLILMDFIGLRARRGVSAVLLSVWVVAVALFCWAVFAVAAYVRG